MESETQRFFNEKEQQVLEEILLHRRDVRGNHFKKDPIGEEDIINALRMIWERLKIIVEPSCSIALALIINNKQLFEGRNVGLIMSGGNIDLDNLPW